MIEFLTTTLFESQPVFVVAFLDKFLDGSFRAFECIADRVLIKGLIHTGGFVNAV